MTRRRITGDTAGSTSLEFAMIGPLFCMLVFAAVETAILVWMQASLRSTAALTARCAAANSPSCANTSLIQSYATDLWNTSTAGMPIAASDVTNNGKISTCNGAPGNYQSVSISHQFLLGVPPLGDVMLSATACFPVP